MIGQTVGGVVIAGTGGRAGSIIQAGAIGVVRAIAGGCHDGDAVAGIRRAGDRELPRPAGVGQQGHGGECVAIGRVLHHPEVAVARPHADIVVLAGDGDVGRQAHQVAGIRDARVAGAAVQIVWLRINVVPRVEPEHHISQCPVLPVRLERGSRSPVGPGGGVHPDHGNCGMDDGGKRNG